MNLIPELPDDSIGWTMQLVHTFFDDLDEYIWDRLVYRLRTLPILAVRPTKIESITALFLVRREAVKEFKATSRDCKRFEKWLDQIGSSKKHTFKGQIQLTQPVAAVPVIK